MSATAHVRAAHVRASHVRAAGSRARSGESARGAAPGDPLGRYTAAATASSAVVIRSYSTSFGLACRLLGQSLRPDIENVYALVRLADEVVDGAAAGAGLPLGAVRSHLDGLERETLAALGCGYSTNLAVHAFAQTARRAGIGPDLVGPFFDSMRRDCDVSSHSSESLNDYIYGSAEVVGLMCLRVFLVGENPPEAELHIMTESARRLGAAFQKVNFLRDVGRDSSELGREYLPGVESRDLTERHKAALVADLRADLDAAIPGLELLPERSRRAVALAHALFSELADRIARCPAEVLLTTRISVPTAVKVRLAAGALLGLRQVRPHAGARGKAL